jgi:hypothetical protein
LEDSAYDLTFGKGHERPLSEQLLESHQYKTWYKNIAPSGVISDSTKGVSMPPVQVRAGLKSLLTGASGTSAGAMVFPETAPFVGPAGRRELTLRDLISVVPTNSDQMQFAKWDSETLAADPVPEASATGGTTGTKPESSMAFVTVTVNIRDGGPLLPRHKTSHGRRAGCARPSVRESTRKSTQL